MRMETLFMDVASKVGMGLNRKLEKAKTKPEKAKKQTIKAKQKLASWLLHRLLAS